MHIASPRRRAAALGLATAAAIALVGCTSAAAPGESAAPTTTGAAAEPGQRLAIAYDGGLAVLDAVTLEQLADIPLPGFNRLNTAGDGEHAFVTTEGGFQVLATGADGSAPELTGTTFPATTPGHVVRHEGRTVLFDDGTGDFWAFDTDALLGAEGLPETTEFTSEAAHHGVAVELADGTMLSTLGDSESRSGVRVLDPQGEETARFEECPAVHGEGVAADEAVLFGCEDGVLTYVDGAFAKLESPDEFGRVGNAYVTDESAIAVVDYKDDPDAEGSLLHRVGFVDTAAADLDGAQLDVVDLPEGVEYTWRGVGRDAEGAAWLLGTDGALHRIDVETQAITASYPVIEAWEGPAEWQEAHPALVVDGDQAIVTEPAANAVHRIDLATGEVLATGTIEGTPNELALVG
ncbi:zinc metallochaperone AztD [Agrococcus sp. SL85]|uniref:zinc metallochaperone AztD n=1 Tax=Agrococcus sp. SL85 TaxID=2995141 RepID=UPI00226C9EFC|nr:zinc metallochaperone AztD [Agrococcus sp. SL85]WAC67051.1 zinc metallochaperone AztD [Agrococcus sp. SL85]